MGDDAVVDAVVVGAGYSGLLMLHRLRGQGLRVRAFDGAADVGGTWWWQGFPGARPEVEGYVAQYLDERELAEQWGWSERFPAGYEVLRWLWFVADRLDLRRDVTLSTRVESATYDEDRGRWSVRTEHGELVDTRFLVACTGSTGPPREDVVPGRARFTGPVLHTARWPQKGPELAGARVGVVGTGRAGVQLVPALAGRAGHVTVFARTPRAVAPLVNPVYGWQERDVYRARFDELRATVPYTAHGLEPEPGLGRVSLADAYADGSPRTWLRWYTDPAGAAEAAAYVRDRMVARLDPRLVDVLVPDEADRRPPVLDRGFLEAFALDHVTLVDARTTPVVAVRPEGLELADGTVHPLDVLALATGCEQEHPLARVDVRGRGGRRLDAVRPGAVDPLGLTAVGFPNLLITGGPGSPDPALCARTTVLQAQVAWIARAVADLRDDGLRTLEPVAAPRDATATAAGVDDVGAYRGRCDLEALTRYPGLARQ